MPTALGMRDVPIDDAAADLLDLGRYAQALAAFTSQCDTPITVGIQGDWGSGKTSLMRLVRAKLIAAGGIATIELNTWQFAQIEAGDALPLLLLTGLAQQVTKESTRGRRLMSGSLQALASLKGVNVNVAGFGIGLEKSDAPSHADVLNLKAEFQAAVDDLLTRTRTSRLVVFIDDLDRIRPERAVEILEVLKNFVDVTGAVFVIACDYKVVVKGLRVKFGVGEADLDGRSFFDKIIQVPFRMPVHQYDVEHYVGRMLEGIGWSHTETDLPLYRALLEHSVGFNPRSIKRTCNTLLLLGLVARGDGESGSILDDEASSLLLFGVMCLEASCESVHLALAARANDASALESLLGIGQEDGEPNLGPDVNERVGDERRAERARRLLAVLARYLDPGATGRLHEDAHAKLRGALQLSAVSSVNGTPAEEPRRWSTDDVQESFSREENRVAMALLDFAKEYSYEGRVTAKSRSKNAAVRFYVSRVRDGRRVTKVFFSCQREHMVLMMEEQRALLGDHAIDRFCARLTKLFGSDVDTSLKQPNIRTVGMTAETVEGFKAAVLEALGRPVDSLVPPLSGG